MAHFNYLAQDNQNKRIKGTFEAKDLLEAKTKLRQQGLYIIWLHRESNFLQRLGLAKIKNLDLAIFSHQFSVMISSGIPLIRALKALADEATNQRLRAIINELRFDIENGSSLSNSLSKHPKVFSQFFINLIKSGEAAGILPIVLQRLANHLEKEEDLKRKIISSFAYPVIVGIVAFLVVSFLLIFIVPVFSSVYKTLRISLPGPTIALIILSNIFTKFWWIVLLLIGLIYYLIKTSGQNKTFVLILDRFKLKAPFFGQLNRKVSISRFVHTLSTMLASGLPLSSALAVVKEVVGNRVAFNAIESIQKEINQGKYLSEAVEHQEIFPAIVVQMLAVGEESGNLTTMLDKCADFLDDDVDTIVKSLIVKLEPALTFLLAVLVGFIALAIYLPMFDLIRQISR